jgi:hypothetical protein
MQFFKEFSLDMQEYFAMSSLHQKTMLVVLVTSHLNGVLYVKGKGLETAE